MIADRNLQQWITGCGFQIRSQLNSDSKVSVIWILINHLDEEFLTSSQAIGSFCIAQPIVDTDGRERMMDRSGLIALNNDSIQCSTRRGQIVLKLQRGHLQRVAVVAETVGRHGIRRQVASIIHLQSEKILHRVLILNSIQSSQNDATIGLLTFSQSDFDGL